MSTINRNFGAAVVAIVLGIGFQTEAIADSPTQVTLAKNSLNSASPLKDKPRSEWGWWIKKDWQSYQEKGLSQQAKKMLIKAARYGNAQAQYVLGMMYANFESDEKALYWLNRAAAQDHASAKFAYNYYLNDADDYGIGC